MPIRYFDVYARELKLVQETRLSALANIRLGIEGHNWLRKLMLNTTEGEPVAVGGVPLALEAEIVKELDIFRKRNITPIFVFNGLPVHRKDNKQLTKTDSRLNSRSSTWEYYWQGRTEQALRDWSTSGSIVQNDLIPFVIRVLQEHNAEFMRAPYSSWGQLSYLYKHELQPIHAIYSSSDVLMFDVDRVITSINHSKDTFTWILKDTLLHDFGITPDQFLDVCILAGTDWSSTFPALVTTTGFSFKSAIDVTCQYRTGFNAIQAYADNINVKGSNYCDMFCRAICAIRYHIVMYLDGTVGPLNAEYAPNDLHEIIGYRLPNPVYQLLARGIIHPPMLIMLTTGMWFEFAPLDNGESSEYHRLVTKWVAETYLQNTTTLSSNLSSFFKQRKITMSAWFDPQSEIILNNIKTAPINQRSVAVVGVSDSNIRSLSPGNLGELLEHSSDILEYANYKTSTTKDTKSPSSSSNCNKIGSELFLATLINLGFVSRDGNKTAFGKALHSGLQKLGKSADDASQWGLLVAMVLLDQNLLSGDKWSVSYENNRASTNDKHERAIRILSRIATLQPAYGRNKPLKLPYNRDILAFCSAGKLVQKTSTCIFEAACILQSVTQPTLSSSLLDTLAQLRILVPLDCMASDVSGLIAHALLVGYADHGIDYRSHTINAIGDSIRNPKVLINDIWNFINATLVMIQTYVSATHDTKCRENAEKVLGDLKDAVKWAEPVFLSAL